MRSLFKHSAATAALLTLLMACSPQVETQVDAEVKPAEKPKISATTKPTQAAAAASETTGENTPCTEVFLTCLLYTSPSPRDGLLSRMPSSA